MMGAKGRAADCQQECACAGVFAGGTWKGACLLVIEAPSACVDSGGEGVPARTSCAILLAGGLLT